jgi:hypothetical protein
MLKQLEALADGELALTRITPIPAVSSQPLADAGFRLRTLGFDPLEQLLQSHRRLVLEICYQDALRAGHIKEILPNGRQRAYRPDLVLQLLQTKSNIEEKLLKYVYTDPAKLANALGVDDNEDIEATLVVRLSKRPETVADLVKEHEAS